MARARAFALHRFPISEQVWGRPLAWLWERLSASRTGLLACPRPGLADAYPPRAALANIRGTTRIDASLRHDRGIQMVSGRHPRLGPNPKPGRERHRERQERRK